MKRHRHQEFIRFLNTVEAKVPKRKAIHAIVDNYATSQLLESGYHRLNLTHENFH